MTIQQALELYRTYDEEMGYEHRGYPACVGEFDGVVAIADVDGENGSSLEMHNGEDFIAWMDEAVHFAKAHNTDMCEAVNETRPEPKVAYGH